MNDASLANIIRTSCKVEFNNKVIVFKQELDSVLKEALLSLQEQFKIQIANLLDEKQSLKWRIHLLEAELRQLQILAIDQNVKLIQRKEVDQLKIVIQLLNNKIKKLTQILAQTGLFDYKQIQNLLSEKGSESLDQEQLASVQRAVETFKAPEPKALFNKKTQTEIKESYFAEQERMKIESEKLKQTVAAMSAQQLKLEANLANQLAATKQLKSQAARLQHIIQAKKEKPPIRDVQVIEKTQETIKFLQFDDLLYKNLDQFENASNFDVRRSWSIKSSSKQRPASSTQNRRYMTITSTSRTFQVFS